MFLTVKQGEGEADVAEELSQGLTRHFTYFQKEELKRMLFDTGFTVEKIYVEHEKKRLPDKRDIDWISCFSRKI